MYPTSIDLAVAAWFHAHATPLVTHLMLFLTNVQSNLAIGVMSAAIAVVLMRKRDRLWLVTLALLVPTGLAMNVLFKHAFARVRPVFDDPLLTLTTFSFPSGHVAGATLFYGFLVAYLWERVELPATRVLLVGAAVLLVALVALSRIYLGVHYLTDVVGAAAWSLAWLAIVLGWRRGRAAR